MKILITLVGLLLTNLALAGSDFQDATVLALRKHLDISLAEVRSIEAELKVIRALAVPKIDQSHIYYDIFPGVFSLSLTEKIRKNTLERLLRQYDLQSEGYLHLPLKKTGMKDVDQVLKGYGASGLKLEVTYLEESPDGSFLSYEVTFPAADLSNFNYPLIVEALRAAKSLSSVKWAPGRNGRLNPQEKNPISRVEAGQKIQYTFWEAYGDCMAGCRGRYYYFSVERTGENLVAKRVEGF